MNSLDASLMNLNYDQFWGDDLEARMHSSKSSSDGVRTRVAKGLNHLGITVKNKLSDMNDYLNPVPANYEAGQGWLPFVLLGAGVVVLGAAGAFVYKNISSAPIISSMVHVDNTNIGNYDLREAFPLTKGPEEDFLVSPDMQQLSFIPPQNQEGIMKVEGDCIDGTLTGGAQADPASGNIVEYPVHVDSDLDTCIKQQFSNSGLFSGDGDADFYIIFEVDGGETYEGQITLYPVTRPPGFATRIPSTVPYTTATSVFIPTATAVASAVATKPVYSSTLPPRATPTLAGHSTLPPRATPTQVYVTEVPQATETTVPPTAVLSYCEGTQPSNFSSTFYWVSPIQREGDPQSLNSSGFPIECGDILDPSSGEYNISGGMVTCSTDDGFTATAVQQGDGVYIETSGPIGTGLYVMGTDTCLNAGESLFTNEAGDPRPNQ